jgi:hypothetical protein
MIQEGKDEHTSSNDTNKTAKQSSTHKKHHKLHHHETDRHSRDYHDAYDYADEHGTLLHVACQRHPPPWIIQTLCAVQQQWISCRKNAFQYTPLHVAAAWGARPEMVQYLT